MVGNFEVPKTASFDSYVAALKQVRTRPEITVEELPAPRSLAPLSYALGMSIAPGQGDEIGSGRLVLLGDPAGSQAWDGPFRIVVFTTCQIEQEIALDPLLAEVAWSWLTDALTASGVQYTALGGTVTSTCSTRFGDIAGPQRADDIELRASWTPLDSALEEHLAAFLEVMASAAGLPPEGVSSLAAYKRQAVRA